MKKKFLITLCSVSLLCMALFSGCSEAINGDVMNEIQDEVPDDDVEELEEIEILPQLESSVDIYMKKSVDSSKPLNDPKGLYELHKTKNYHWISMLTGEYSPNQTQSKYDVGGTDLGIMINKGEKTFIFFGDTFSRQDMDGNWRSNVCAITTDSDYTDGITIESMITGEDGNAKELLSSKKVDNVEMTKIPTGGICIDDKLYLSFMSVKHWGTAGKWNCNYGSVAVSKDDGETWKIIENLRWPGDSYFCQMVPVLDGDMVYVLGITGGRFDGARLMRVSKNQYENYNAYEYLIGIDDQGKPIFEKGEAGLYSNYFIISGEVGEVSVMYSEYLGEWLVTYLENNRNLVLRSAKELWGPWSNSVSMASCHDYPRMYGAFMNPRYVSDDGKRICLLVSEYAPVYQTAVVEVELVRKDEQLD